MKNKLRNTIRELHSFLILWLTQSFSTLGSSTTSFALVIWSYQQQGSALSIGAVCGWLFIPVMNANMDVLFRSEIPVEIQERVYSARNTLQFFTIPLGYLCGGLLVDKVFEPFMAAQSMDSIWEILLGAGKGSGAALLFLVIGLFGALSCLPFRLDRHIWELEKSRRY